MDCEVAARVFLCKGGRSNRSNNSDDNCDNNSRTVQIASSVAQSSEHVSRAVVMLVVEGGRGLWVRVQCRASASDGFVDETGGVDVM